MHPAEHPLALWLEKRFEETTGDHVTMQVIAKGATYMGPVIKTDIRGAYEVHTAIQPGPQTQPVVVPVIFCCDSILSFIPIDEEMLGGEKSQIVT